MTAQWISLEQASEITGASQAIILDTVNKHQNNSKNHLVNVIDEELFLDRYQILSLFPSSANPVEKEKIPGAVFRWFDELRRAYETSMQTMFKRVESVKEQHKNDIEQQYKLRLAELTKQHQQHITDIKNQQFEQNEAFKHQIKKLERDTDFYQQQVLAQQNTISQLNNRYDTVVLALRNKADFEKDITPETNNLSHQEVNDDSPKLLTKAEYQSQIDNILEQAYAQREESNFSESVALFEQAALLGNANAMGALGRSYFIGEGVENNIETAIAWLFLASEHGFSPAQKKVDLVKAKYPEQYQHGIELAETFKIQIKLQIDSNCEKQAFAEV